MSAVALPLAAPDLYRHARLSETAYLIDPDAIAKAIEPMGLRFVGLVGNNTDCQAFVCEDGEGNVTVSIRGTQFIENTSLRDILSNLNVMRRTLRDGTGVMRGYFDALEATIPDIEAILPPGPLTVTGHSMGGIRAQLTRFFWPQARVISYGAPKGAEAAFWACHGDGIVRVVRERDFAPTHPLVSAYAHPGSEIWFHAGIAQIVSSRPGINESEPDHDVSLYVSDAAKLAAPAAAQAGDA